MHEIGNIAYKDFAITCNFAAEMCEVLIFYSYGIFVSLHSFLFLPFPIYDSFVTFDL